MSGQRRLAEPHAARVRSAPDGMPLSVDGQAIAHARESWLVEDRWWTDQPLRRRYWELVSEGGRDLIVFHDLAGGRWFRQR